MSDNTREGKLKEALDALHQIRHLLDRATPLTLTMSDLAKVEDQNKRAILLINMAILV